MRTHAEMEKIFNAAGGVSFTSRAYNPAGLLCVEYTLTWEDCVETAHNTQANVDAACDRMCDRILARS